MRSDSLATAAPGDGEAQPINVAGDPLLLFVLLAGAAVLFAVAFSLTRAFHLREQQLAQQWFERGRSELAAGQTNAAISDLRSALLYERDDNRYRLTLAEALFQDGQYSKAEGYFLSVYEAQPADGQVNLELGRVARLTGSPDNAVRYYEGAIYGVWPSNPDDHRRAARLELAHLLLDLHRTSDAEAQLVSLSGDLPDSPELLQQVGTMFVDVGDNNRASAMYARALRLEPQNESVQMGLATAEFNLGRYALARQHLRSVLQREPANQQAAAMYQTADLVLSLDPFARVAGPERRARIIRDFNIADSRLQQCRSAGKLAAQLEPPSAVSEPNLAELDTREQTMKLQITDANLRDDPELGQSAIDLVFAIERQAQSVCGAMTLQDDAILRIAALHPE